MKISSALFLASVITGAHAFAPSRSGVRSSTAVYGTPGMDMSGNNWKVSLRV